MQVKGKTPSVSLHPASFFKEGKHVHLNCYAFVFVTLIKSTKQAVLMHFLQKKGFLDLSLYLAVRYKRKYFS